MGVGPGFFGEESKSEKLALAARLRWKDPAFRQRVLKHRKPFKFGRLNPTARRSRFALVSEWRIDPLFDELQPGEVPEPRGDADAVV